MEDWGLGLGLGLNPKLEPAGSWSLTRPEQGTGTEPRAGVELGKARNMQEPDRDREQRA